jgi:hypothetical protein
MSQENTMMAEKYSENANDQYCKGSVNFMESLNMFKQSIEKLYL